MCNVKRVKKNTKYFLSITIFINTGTEIFVTFFLNIIEINLYNVIILKEKLFTNTNI